MRRIQKIHFIGIGGAGMSGIAEVMLNMGYEVSGSELQKNAMTERLIELGATITFSHVPSNVAECDAVVLSSAIPEHNVELVTARKRRIPIVPRAEMLAELMRFRHGIAVAGTHGKTTTTSLIATIFAEAGLDPTFVVGGQLNSFGSHARLGKGDYFIAEADESDASFLHLMPMSAVVTNIDADHMSTYQDDFHQLKQAFQSFIHRLPFYGLAVVCIDDPMVKEWIPQISRPVMTYGFSETADVRISNWHQTESTSEFSVHYPGEPEAIQFALNIPGRHNVLNATAAIAIAKEAGIDFDVIRKGLTKFQGIGRRFQCLGHFQLSCGKVMLIDDYGHHPREVKAVIDAIRTGWPNQRIVMVYQPHRYTRTKALYEDFSSVLSEVDQLCLLDVYAAGEEPIGGADSRSLCGSIRNRGKLDPIFVSENQDLLPLLHNILQDGDILLMQGAGDIGKLAKLVAAEFEPLSQAV